jgi:hypothetical protein
MDYYDPPHYMHQGVRKFNPGDEGWSHEELENHIKKHGIQEPLLVGRSRGAMEAGDHQIYVFNGNH